MRWSEIAARIGADPFAAAYLAATAFPMGSWPINIEPPTQGSLDADGYHRLLGHLVAASSADADVFAFYGLLAGLMLDGLDPHDGRLYSLPLAELEAFAHDDYFLCSPNNIWPADRSWFVYTDYDLWATKVSGSEKLISALINDDELETIERP